MTKSAPFYFLVLQLPLTILCDVNTYLKSDFQVEDRDDLEQELKGSSWSFDRPAEDNDLAPREEALQKMQEILGIRSQNENLAHRKVPPQFMMELYNTIADPSGVTRGRNPYNARVVRSFIEKDISLSHFYFFNVSGLEINESVLEAELHLYRKKTPTRNTRPLTSASLYYLIKIYQVLDDRNLDIPDLHRLLSVRYVGAHASGWQVFNVKEAVLGWMNGEPNLGLLVTIQNLFEGEVLVEFSRRNNYHHSKQPILVLFDDDNCDRSGGTSEIAPRYYAYGNQANDERNREKDVSYEKDIEKIDLENGYDDAKYYKSHKRQRRNVGQLEEVPLAIRREPEFFQRQKRRREDNEEEEEDEMLGYDDPLGAAVRRRQRDAALSRGRITSGGIVSRDRSRGITRVLTSMDIYERAAFREKMEQAARDRSTRRSTTVVGQSRRPARSANNQNAMASGQPGNATECTRHELYVDFRDIGLSSSIIAPAGYSAYQCKGVCEPPLSQDQRPTNHATIQAIVHKMVKGVERPCCVPTKLLSTSILFYDDNENVVLKMYEDMIADRCGCR